MSDDPKINLDQYIVLPSHVILKAPSFLETLGFHTAPTIIIIVLMTVIFLLVMYMYTRLSASRHARYLEYMQHEKDKLNVK
jgi:hypothetical protein